MTNADRIKTLNTVQLANYLLLGCAAVEKCGNCPMNSFCKLKYRRFMPNGNLSEESFNDLKKWLESEAKDER